MISKSIQGSPGVPTTVLRSEVQTAENLKDQQSETQDASLPYGSDVVKGKTHASADSRAAKLSEEKLQASARAADLNSQLDAQGPKSPKTNGTAANYEWMISGVKDNKKRDEGSSIFKDFDQGTMTKKP